MPGFYKRTARSVQFADATRLAFGDDEFDMVIANHIMEHIPPTAPPSVKYTGY